MDGIKEVSLRRALESAGLGVLPVRYSDGAGFWLRAVLLLRKRGNVESYALGERYGDGRVRIVRDCGDAVPIVGILGIYPYVYLDEARFGNVYSNAVHERAYLDTVFSDWVSRMPGEVRFARLLEGVRTCGDDELDGYDRERIRYQMERASLPYSAVIRDEERVADASAVAEDSNVRAVRAAVRRRRAAEDAERAALGDKASDGVPSDVVDAGGRVKKGGRRGRKRSQ